MCGRAGEFNVLVEPEFSQPPVGQIILEQLDLIVDPSTRKVIPDPRSPEMPMVETSLQRRITAGMRFAVAHPNPYGLRIPAIRYLQA